MQLKQVRTSGLPSSARAACPARAGRLSAAAGANRRPRQRSARAARAAAAPLPLPRKAREDTWSLEDIEGVLVHDENKEQGRRHMRELSTFTFKRWAFHRSTSRYVRHMSGIFQSRIVRGLAQPLLSAGATAALICLYEQGLQDGQLPAYLPSLQMPTLPFDITSFALSLLLVFRTNTSYDRWQQAMGAWSDIATRSRDTLRQLLAATSRGGGGLGGPRAAAVSAAAAGRWLVAFSRSLKAALTEDSDLEAELQGVLTQEELSLLLAAHHRPSFALAVLSELAEAAPMRDAQRARVDENFTMFQDACGRCERLLRTPIPLSYTRHTSRFMVIWLSVLPLGLWPYCGFGAVPITVVISFLLLGIEEIGVAIEEPFSILPLEDMCQELEFGLSDVLDQASPAKHAAKQAAAVAAREAADAAAAAAAASNVAPFPPGTFGLGRGGGGAREPVSASTIFDSFDDE